MPCGTHAFSLIVTTHKIKMITLQEIINLKTDLFRTSRVKLVRHRDNRAEYRELIKDEQELLDYQKEFRKNVFRDCEYIISFIGQE